MAAIKPPPTKQAIVKRLNRLSATMHNLGVDIDYYGGFSDWSRHGVVLELAARQVNGWSQEILNEIREEL